MSLLRLKIVPSEFMSSKKKVMREDGFIRLPKETRRQLQVADGDKVNLGVGKNTILKTLEVKIAYISDARFAKTLPEPVGFLTQRTYDFLNLANKNTWIDSIGKFVLSSLGCDPEFLLLDGNRCMYAGYLHRLAEFDGNTVIGCDGPCAEIRPQFDYTSEKVIEKMKQAIEQYDKFDYLNKYKWAPEPYFNGLVLNGWGERYRSIAAGGHIHIGLSKDLLASESSTLQKVCLSLTRLLDHFIAVPLKNIDAETSNQRRIFYGTAGDYRLEGPKIEWRTLSNVWLVHPKYASAVMETAQHIVSWALNQDRSADQLVKEIIPSEVLKTNIDLLKSDAPKSIPKKDCKKRLKDLAALLPLNKPLEYLEEFFRMQRTEFVKMYQQDLRKTWLS